MASKLIRLEDDILVEVEAEVNEVQQIAGGVPAKVKATIDQIQPILLKICQPVVATVTNLRKNVDFEQVEIEVGLNFNAEGNIYITKATLGANVLVRMTLKKSEESK